MKNVLYSKQTTLLRYFLCAVCIIIISPEFSPRSVELSQVWRTSIAALFFLRTSSGHQICNGQLHYTTVNNPRIRVNWISISFRYRNVKTQPPAAIMNYTIIFCSLFFGHKATACLRWAETNVQCGLTVIASLLCEKFRLLWIPGQLKSSGCRLVDGLSC